MAEAKLSKEASDNGWQLERSDGAEYMTLGTPGKTEGEAGVQIKQGQFVALKRSETGSGLIEQHGHSLEQLEDRIKGWHAVQPGLADNTQMTPEQRFESGKATVASRLSSGARQAGEVIVDSGTEKKGKAKVKSVSFHPGELKPEVTDLDDDAAEALVRVQPPSSDQPGGQA